MKKYVKKIFISIISLVMVLVNFSNHMTSVSATSPEAKIYIDTDKVITKDFEGFGVQWDPSDLFDYTDEQWDSFYEKAEFLKPNILRVMLHDGDSYVIGFDENNMPIYDWNSVMMKRVYKILDFAEENDVPVMLGEWRSISERGLLSYTQTGKTVKWDNPLWQQMIIDCLEHLIVEKGYTCIRYYNMVNEPNYYKRDHPEVNENDTYIMWKKGITQLREKMDQSDVEAIRKIKIVGPDVYDKQEAWIKQAKSDELKDKIELTEIHRYAPKSEVESGLIETKLKNWKKTAEEMDPRVKEEGFALGEMGLSGTGPGDSQLNARKYDYGVDIFDYALQATRAGLKFGSVWGFEDSMHVQHNDIVNSFKDQYGPEAKTEEGKAYKVHTPTGDPKIDNDIKIWGFWNELGEEMAIQNEKAGLTTERANTVKASDEQLKPWYYTWSMFCRYMPSGMQILETTESGIDQVRATSGIIPRGNNKADLSIAVVNTTNKEQKVNLHVPNADGTTQLNQYYYFDGDRPMNNKGQLEVYDTLENVDLAKGLEVTMPANTCMIFTTLGYNRESHPMTLTTGQLPSVTDVDIYEQSHLSKITVGETYQMATRFTPSIANAPMEWKIVDYFGNDSDIATIDQSGKLIANKAGQFKIIGHVQGNPKISDSIDMTATTVRSFVDDLETLDKGIFEGLVRDDNSANFNNAKTVKRSDSNANGKTGIITYQADGIFDFHIKAFSLNTNLKSSNNFTVELSEDGLSWENIDCEFEQDNKLSSGWYPYMVTPKNIDISKNYKYLRIILNSKGYKTYDPQYGGCTISYGEQSPSEIQIDNTEKFVSIGEKITLKASVLPQTVSQQVTYRVVENNGKPTTKASIDENGVLTGKEIGNVTVVVETQDRSLSAYYPLQIVGGYLVDNMDNFDFMYDYGSFTFERNADKFGDESIIKRTDNTPQSITYAYNSIYKASFETFSNGTFTDEQASIYMSKDGIHYDFVDSTIIKMESKSDFTKYKVEATPSNNDYNFVKFEVKNDEKIYNPMISKAEIIYNDTDEKPRHINVVDDRITLNVGKQKNINLKFAPLNAKGNVTYESMDPTIATVNQNGTVNGICVGTTTIKVSLNENEYIQIPVNVLEENIAYRKTVTATSEYDESKKAEFAVDGDYNTRWGTKYTDKNSESIVVDLGQEKSIDTVKIFWEAARAKTYNIEVAGEDKQFKVIKEMSNMTENTNDSVNFDTVKARYVKIHGIKPVGKYGYSIYELEVYNNSQIVNVDSVAFDDKNTELYKGQTKDLEVNVLPQNATYPLAVYSSSNENVVKIVNGKMFAIQIGKSQVVAEVDGKLTTLNVEVVDENKYKIADELTTLTIQDGKVVLLNMSDYTLSLFTSTNEKVVALDGTVHTPIFNTTVDIVVKVEDKNSSTKGDYALTKPITLHIIGDDTLFKQLKSFIEECENLDASLYKPSTYAQLKNALLEARKVFNSQNLVVDEVEEVFDKLYNAFALLEFKEDRTLLNQQIEYYKNLDRNLYTNRSYQKMLDILSNIESSIDDDSSQEDIKKAFSQLNAIPSLLIKKTDYDLVKNKLNELKQEDLSIYTTKSLKVLTKAMNNAKLYLENENMTTQGLYEQYTFIMEAYRQLQLKGDKTTLETLIKRYEQKDLSMYRPKSVQQFKEILLKAKEKLQDELTEHECLQLIQELQNAYNSLEKMESDVFVKTNDITPIYGYVLLGLISFVGLVFLKRRKE